MNSEQTLELRHLIVQAHYDAAMNNPGNISAVVAVSAYQGSGNPYQAIAAGILSMGGMHAPIDSARSLVRRIRQDYKQAERSILYLLDNKIKIPGFGNSFYKDKIDPSFHAAYNQYMAIAGEGNPIDIISQIVNGYFRSKAQDTFLYPNAAIITAAIAELLELPPGQEIVLALEGRIRAWVILFDTIKK